MPCRVEVRVGDDLVGEMEQLEPTDEEKACLRRRNRFQEQQLYNK